MNDVISDVLAALLSDLVVPENQVDLLQPSTILEPLNELQNPFVLDPTTKANDIFNTSKVP
jgi:hypothetical protein